MRGRLVIVLALLSLSTTSCMSRSGPPPTVKLIAPPTGAASGASATPTRGLPTGSPESQGTGLSQLVATATVLLGSTAVSGMAGTAAVDLQATALSFLQGTATPRTVVPTPAAAELPALGVVARNETDQAFGIVMLSSVPLQVGHAYQLQVKSSTGPVAFSGSWVVSANTAGGPAVDTGLLDDTADVAYDVVPPAGITGNWTVAVTVQNKGSGNLSAAIVEVQPG
jgi:hypothetical protein